MGYVKAADGEYWPLFYTMILDGLLLKLACSGLRPIGISFGYKLSTKSTRDVTVRVGHLLKPVSQCHWQPELLGFQELERVAPCCNKNTSFMSTEGVLTYQNEADKDAAKVFRASVHAKWDHAFRRLNKEKPGISGLMNFTEVCSRPS